VGYRVETAKTGAEAIVKSQARTYAAILLDLILPDTGGWEILHAIRTAGPNQNTPVVVVTVVAEKGVAKSKIHVLAALTRVDPLTYGVDGVRGLLIGRTHFGIPLDIAVLLGVGVLFVAFGAWRFSKIEA